jgi:RNA binding exosome subunit
LQIKFKGQYLDLSYFRAEEQRHLEEYRKVIQYLTIQEPKENSDMKKEITLTLLRMQGYNADKIKQFEVILQRAKDSDEFFEEFRKLKDEPSPQEFKKKTDDNSLQKIVPQQSNSTHQKKYNVAKGEFELVRRLDDGWNLVKSLSGDRYLLERL